MQENQDLESTSTDAEQAAEDGSGEEVATVLQVNTNTSINASLEEIEDAGVLKEMVKKLRRENAEKRTVNKTVEKELDEFRTWKESQLTELEKAQGRAASLEEELTAARRDAILEKFHVPEDLADFVTGSVEEMREKAERLGKLGKSDDSVADQAKADLLAGSRGAPIKPKRADGGAFLEMLASEQGI